MSEQEKFREVEPLRLPGWRNTVACLISARCTAVVVGDECLAVPEARALRDWLDKALPEQTVTVCWTVPADQEATL